MIPTQACNSTCMAQPERTFSMRQHAEQSSWSLRERRGRDNLCGLEAGCTFLDTALWWSLTQQYSQTSLGVLACQSGQPMRMSSQ